MNLKSFNPMKIKIRYTKLPKQKLPSFQMQGELQTDEYGNVIGAPYLMGRAGMQSGPNPLDYSWEQAPAGAINPKSAQDPVVSRPKVTVPWLTQEGKQDMFPTVFPKPLVFDDKNPYGQLAINQKNDASRNVINNLGKTPEQPKDANKRKGPFNAFDYLSMASTALDWATQGRKEKEFQRNIRKQTFDITRAASPEFEGNYDINTGMYQPNRIFNPNEGMNMVKLGGQLNNTMKIRITKGPQENMAYGGQSNYGLDLGRKKVYTDMTDSRSESVSNTLTGVPRYMANIEAEGGETVYGDLNGDGGMEHMKISGPRHSQGGVPLNVPEGSFVFSDTKKMKIKDPAILAKFGKSMQKGGMTPAKIAKQYDINKYKAILEDPYADPLAKATAQLMIKNNEQKLGELAMVQEGMKGFPGGVPNVAVQAGVAMPQAKFGGYLPIYQDKGTVTSGPRKITTKQELEQALKEGYVLDPATKKLKRVQQFDKIPGTAGTPAEYTPTITPVSGGTGDPCKNAKYLGAKGNSYESMFEKVPGVGSHFDPNANQATKDQLRKCWEEGFNTRPKKEGTPDSCGPGLVWNEATKKCEKVDEMLYEEPTTGGGDGGGGKIEVPETGGGSREVPFQFQTPDVFGFVAASAIPPKYRGPYSADLAYNPRQLALEDPQYINQQISGLNRNTAETLANYQPGTALASNLSFGQGQAADSIVQNIGRVTGNNVDRFNQFTGQEVLRKDAVNQFNQQNHKYLVDANNIAGQQYDNAMRAQLNNVAMSYANMWDNRADLYDINMNNDTFYRDPITGKRTLKAPKVNIFTSQLYDASNPSHSGGIQNLGTDYETYYNTFLNQVKSGDEKQKHSAADWLARQAIMNNRTSASTSYNPYGYPRSSSYRRSQYNSQADND
jgi:hypothetical protein